MSMLDPIPQKYNVFFFNYIDIEYREKFIFNAVQRTSLKFIFYSNNSFSDFLISFYLNFRRIRSCSKFS